MSGKTILIWFRKDLRIHDNEILIEAVRKADRVLPVYCFDPRHYQNTKPGTLKTGALRASFVIESVADLKKSLQHLGGDLLIRSGRPEEVLPDLVAEYGVNEVYHHREVASEETRVSELVEEALWRHRVNLRHFIGHTLYHKEDLPFPINNIPDTFSQFRKKVERDSLVRPCFDAPLYINVPEQIDWGLLPALSDLIPGVDPSENKKFAGGESEGLRRLKEYFWLDEAIRLYKPSRNKASAPEITSLLSPWIALGCLSPREMYWELKNYEQQRGNSESVTALYQQLLNRDYFRFMFKKHGNKYFHKSGFSGTAPAENPDQLFLFARWKEGQTGLPLVDAVMRELAATGYINGRARHLAANFLVHNLHVNWTWGAAWFEERLIDYCPANNWGNWASVAGVALDKKDGTAMDFVKLAREIDPQGEYVKTWLPEMADIPATAIHQPWLMAETDRIRNKYPDIPNMIRKEMLNTRPALQ